MAASTNQQRPLRGNHRQTSPTSVPGLNHVRRSWSDNNGTHITIETTSYVSSNLAFNSSGNMFNDFVLPQNRRATTFGGSGLISGALGMLENMLNTSQRQAAAHRQEAPAPSRRARFEEPEEYDSGDDLAYGSEDEASQVQSKSVLSKLKDKILDTHRQRARHPTMKRRNTAPDEQREHPAEPRQPAGTRPSRRKVDAEGDRDNDFETHGSSQPPLQSYDDADMLEALELAVMHEERELERRKCRFQRASQQNEINSSHLQTLLDEVRDYEQSLASALRRLDRARNKQQSNRSRRHYSRPERPTTSRQHSARSDEESLEEQTDPRPHRAWFHESNQPDPLLHSFGSHANIFNHFARTAQFGDDPFGLLEDEMLFGSHPNDFHFFAVPSDSLPRKRSRFATDPSSQRERQRAYPTYNQIPQSDPRPATPPKNPMDPAEARELCASYNARWNSLPPSCPDVPFPARGLSPTALTDCSTILAPRVLAPTSTWSHETVMQANVQIFYLGTVGLEPTYTDIGGRVEMGFNKLTATPEQVKLLVETLKQEKKRWHSDRLGRRNGGLPGVNEALQRDERARAVFHAACALMEVALA